jgi:hypothetical protein
VWGWGWRERVGTGIGVWGGRGGEVRGVEVEGCGGTIGTKRRLQPHMLISLKPLCNPSIPPLP